jgi:DNA repair exonuclease SbcCD ATPase subunit
MAKQSGKDKESSFTDSLIGREIPVLTLDNKWYKLLDEVGRQNVKSLETQLNDLLKRQGKINSETKEIKKIKKRLMEEIVTLVDDAANGDKSAEKKIADNKRLVEDCNKKLEQYDDEIVDIPREINELNKKLMIITMEHCYETMQDNTDDIEELDEWLTQVRIDLKKNLIRKQEKEARNHMIYSYMHDIFGPEVVELFDLRYNPEDHHPLTKAELEKQKAKEQENN